MNNMKKNVKEQFQQDINRHRTRVLKRMHNKVERRAIWLQGMIWSTLHRRMYDCEKSFEFSYPMPKRWAPEMKASVYARVAELMSSDTISVDNTNSGLKIAVSF